MAGVGVVDLLVVIVWLGMDLGCGVITIVAVIC